jgi:uncharacterized protein (TIGR01777 family)
MQVVIAGGSGFVGSLITPALLDAGHSVTVLTRSARTAKTRVDARAALVEWNGRSPGAWEASLDGAGGVINLAGEPVAARRWRKARKEQLRASRLDSAAALVRAIDKAAAPPAVLISASGVGYYGACGDETLAEDAPPGDTFIAALCRERESAATAAEALGVRVVQMRIGMLLSRDTPPLSRLLRPFHLFLGGPPGNGRQWWSWIHPDDVAGLFRLALENADARGPINATAPAPVRAAEFCRTLGRVLRRPSWLRIPALRLLFGGIAEMALAGQRAEPHAVLHLGYRFRYPELEPALRAVLGAAS